MAQMNRPMYEHFGARHLAVKGPGAMTSLEEGVMGVLPLDIMSDPVYWYIQGIRVFSALVYVAAGGAGNYGKAGLSLEDTNELILCKILSIDHSENAPVDLYRVARTSFSSDPGIYGVGTDTRIPEGQDSQGIMISNNDNAFPGTRFASIYEDFKPFITTHQVPMIVSPGQAIYLASQTANTALYTTFTWAEIPAYKAEL